MAVTPQDLRGYAVGVSGGLQAFLLAPENDPTHSGVIDPQGMIMFRAASGLFQIVSSVGLDAGVTTVALFGFDSSDQVVSEGGNTPGTTPVPLAENFIQIGGVQIPTTPIPTAMGDIAIESTTAERTGTAQGGSATEIQLDAAAASGTNEYAGMIVRLTGGTGVGQIRQAIASDGSTKQVTVDRAWDTTPDATTVFRVSEGFYLPAPPNQTLVRANTAQSGSAGDIQLDGAASGFDDTYNWMVVRLTGGTGAGQVSTITDYVGATRTATVFPNWLTPPDATTTFEVVGGYYSGQGTPSPGTSLRILTARRLFYGAIGAALIQAEFSYYDKFFFRNDSLTETYTAPFIEMVDPSGLMSFGLDAAINGSTGQLTNRRTAPAGITFGTAQVAVPGGLLAPGARIGVHVRVRRPTNSVAILNALAQFTISGS